jgi:hypothetical protein
VTGSSNLGSRTSVKGRIEWLPSEDGVQRARIYELEQGYEIMRRVIGDLEDILLAARSDPGALTYKAVDTAIDRARTLFAEE